MIAELDLFGALALPGLATKSDIIAADEAVVLIGNIDGMTAWRPT